MDAEHAARRQRQAVAVEALLDDSWRGPLGGGGSGAGGPADKPPHEEPRKPHAVPGSGAGSGTAPGAGGGVADADAAPADADADAAPADDSLPVPTESGGEGLKGASTVEADNYALTVTSGTSGYLAEILLRCTWDMPPRLLFALFTHPNNSALFRDIKTVRGRKVLDVGGGVKVVEVEQCSDLRVLWRTLHFSTTLKVTEDSSDAERLRITFEMVRSNVLSRFSGHWTLDAVRGAGGELIGCTGLLRQDVLPKGMPMWVQRLPGVGRVLRGVSTRAISRVVQDINTALARIHDMTGERPGLSQHEALDELCGVRSVGSHGIAFDEDGSADGSVDGNDA